MPDSTVRASVEEERIEFLCSFEGAGQRVGRRANHNSYPPETRDLWLRVVEIGERLDQIGWRPTV
jgi:hypothetical protein